MVPQGKFYGIVVRVHEYIERRVENVLKTEVAPDGNNRYDFLAPLVKRTRDRKVFRDETCMLFIATADTSACLLTNMLFLLGRYPSTWSKLQEEVKYLEGSRPTLRDLENLKTHQILCLRE